MDMTASDYVSVVLQYCFCMCLCVHSLRAQYGSGSWRNAVHGSDSSESAARYVSLTRTL